MPYVYCPPKGVERLKKVIARTEPNGQRLYTTPSGKKYPSVTTVLAAHSKEGIDAWKERVGQEEAELTGKRASARGTRIHDLVEQTLNNKVVKPGLMDLEMYRKLMGPLSRINNIHLQEQALYSDRLRLAGRVDCIGEYRGRLSVIDFKTSTKAKKPSYIEGYCMQVCAYGTMYEELFGIKIEQGVIIIGVDDDKPQVFVVDLAAWLPRLLHYRDLWEKNNVHAR